MRFTPKSEDELNPLIPAGVYDAEVVKAEEKQSKAGNDMIALTLRVYLADGNTALVNDWLMEKVQYKLLNFCNATGLRAVYDSGELQADHCLGKSLKVKLTIKTDEVHGEQNSVKDYVCEKPKPASSGVIPGAPRAKPGAAPYADPNAVGVAAGPTDDEIPF